MRRLLFVAIASLALGVGCSDDDSNGSNSGEGELCGASESEVESRIAPGCDFVINEDECDACCANLAQEYEEGCYSGGQCECRSSVDDEDMDAGSDLSDTAEDRQDPDTGDTTASGAQSCDTDADLPTCNSCCEDEAGYNDAEWGGIVQCVCINTETCADASPVDCGNCCVEAGYPTGRIGASSGDCQCEGAE
jgi:hypothetical protein